MGKHYKKILNSTYIDLYLQKNSKKSHKWHVLNYIVEKKLHQKQGNTKGEI